MGSDESGATGDKYSQALAVPFAMSPAHRPPYESMHCEYALSRGKDPQSIRTAWQYHFVLSGVPNPFTVNTMVRLIAQESPFYAGNHQRSTKTVPHRLTAHGSSFQVRPQPPRRRQLPVTASISAMIAVC